MADGQSLPLEDNLSAINEGTDSESNFAREEAFSESDDSQTDSVNVGKEEENEPKRVNYLVSIAKGSLIFLLFYIVLYAVIVYFVNKPVEGEQSSITYVYVTQKNSSSSSH